MRLIDQQTYVALKVSSFESFLDRCLIVVFASLFLYHKFDPRFNGMDMLLVGGTSFLIVVGLRLLFADNWANYCWNQMQEGQPLPRDVQRNQGMFGGDGTGGIPVGTK